MGKIDGNALLCLSGDVWTKYIQIGSHFWGRASSDRRAPRREYLKGGGGELVDTLILFYKQRSKKSTGWQIWKF